MNWQSLLDLLPGWLLGLLSSLLTIACADWLRSSRRRKMFKDAAFSELEFSLDNLVWIVWKLSMRFGDLDDHTIKWLRPLVTKYGIERARSTSVSAFPVERDMWDKAEKFLDSLVKDPGKRQQLLSHMRVKHARMALSLSKLNLAVLSGGTEALRIIDVTLQKKLLGVMRHVSYYNNLVDETRYYFRLTLSSDLTEVNRKIVEGNLDGAYMAALRQAKMILSHVDGLVNDDSLW